MEPLFVERLGNIVHDERFASKHHFNFSVPGTTMLWQHIRAIVDKRREKKSMFLPQKTPKTFSLI